ncbi:MAG: hypothetical protein QXV73_04380 [Candidatus Micrarchaeia archaeon]
MKKITIPAIPPSQNQLLRMFYKERYRIFNKWEWWIWGEIKSKKIEGEIKKVKIVFTFPDRRRRDLDNYAGFQPILNALKHSGLCKDDNFSQVEVSWKAQVGKEGKTDIYLFFKTGGENDNSDSKPKRRSRENNNRRKFSRHIIREKEKNSVN